MQGPGDEKPKPVIRPYTPVEAPDTGGWMDLVVKVYPAGECTGVVMLARPAC